MLTLTIEKEGQILNNEMRQYQAAIACYNRVIELDPKNFDGYLNKGMSYYHI